MSKLRSRPVPHSARQRRSVSSHSRWLRIGSLLAAGALPLLPVVGAQPSWASSLSSGPSSVVKVTRNLVVPVRTATIAAKGAPASVNPPSVCHFGNVKATITATYDDNVLVSVSAHWSDVISCLSTGKETMSFLRDQADLYHAQEKEKNGTTGSCVFPNRTHKTCRGAHSTGVHVCTGDLPCSGVYQVIGFETLELPGGHAWGKAPKSCIKNGSRELICSHATHTVDIPTIK